LLIDNSRAAESEFRNLGDHSFESELRALQMGTNEETMSNIIRTRFSDLEQINLDALLLSGYDS